MFMSYGRVNDLKVKEYAYTILSSGVNSVLMRRCICETGNTFERWT